MQFVQSRSASRRRRWMQHRDGPRARDLAPGGPASGPGRVGLSGRRRRRRERRSGKPAPRSSVGHQAGRFRGVSRYRGGPELRSTALPGGPIFAGPDSGAGRRPGRNDERTHERQAGNSTRAAPASPCRHDGRAARAWRSYEAGRPRRAAAARRQRGAQSGGIDIPARSGIALYGDLWRPVSGRFGPDPAGSGPRRRPGRPQDAGAGRGGIEAARLHIEARGELDRAESEAAPLPACRAGPRAAERVN